MWATRCASTSLRLLASVTMPDRTTRRCGTRQSIRLVRASVKELPGSLLQQGRPSAHAFVRHYEVFAAILLWAGALPLFLIGSLATHWKATVFVLLAVVAGLLAHASTLRPFCSEMLADELAGLEDFNAMGGDNSADAVATGGDAAGDALERDSSSVPPSPSQQVVGPRLRASGIGFFTADEAIAPGPKASMSSDKGKISEELKIVLVVAIVLLATCSAMFFTQGGSIVFRAWISRTVCDCQVSELAKDIQQGYTSFVCRDGVLNLTEEVTVFQTIRRGASMRVLRMAPIYESASSGVPHAWAIARGEHLRPSPCGDGVCGLTVALGDPEDGAGCSAFTCPDPEERAYLAVLATDLQKRITGVSAVSFDALSLPALELTDPWNPSGYLWRFVMAVATYVLTFGGLVWLQYDMYKDSRHEKELEYEAMGPNGQPLVFRPLSRISSGGISEQHFSGERLGLDAESGHDGDSSRRGSIVTFNVRDSTSSCK